MSKPVLIACDGGFFMHLGDVSEVEFSYQDWDLVFRSQTRTMTKRFPSMESRDEFLRLYFEIIE